MLNRFRYVLFGAAVSLSIVACTPQDADKSAASSQAQKDAGAVLTVNGSTVSQHELEMLLRQQPAQRDAPAARQKTIDNLTLQLLAAQEATKKGFDKLPEVVDQMEMSKTSILAQSYVKDFFEHNKPTDAQLTVEYDKLKAEESGNQYRARHILVKTEDEAKTIIAKLNKDPKAFAEIASAESEDPVTKVKGGDLGWFDTKGMVPEFGEAITKLGKGKITQTPVKSQFGYHVIALDDIRPKADSIPPFEQVKPYLAQRVQQDALKKMLDSLKAQAKIDVKA